MLYTRLKEQLLSSKGITLIEVIIVMTISMMLLVPIASMLLTSTKIFHATNQTLNDKSLALGAMEKMKLEILNTSDVKLVDTIPDTLEPDENLLYIRKVEGRYQLVTMSKEHGNQILMDLGHAQTSIVFERGASAKCLSLKLTVDDYFLETTIKLENMGDKGIDVAGNKVLIYAAT